MNKRDELELYTGESVVFEAEHDSHVRMDMRDDPASALSFLKYKLRRDHADILRHVQRIFACISMNDSQELTASIADLFIALQDKGKALRARMLKNARALLSEEDHQYFLDNLDQGLDDERIRPFPSSVLGLGQEENKQNILGSVAKASVAANDPLSEARSRMEYGQVLEAQYILEDGLLDDPYNQELEAELLTIYRYTQDQEAFAALGEQLRIKQIFPSADWRTLEREFEKIAKRESLS